jgi:hypothetical protein
MGGALNPKCAVLAGKAKGNTLGMEIVLVILHANILP